MATGELAKVPHLCVSSSVSVRLCECHTNGFGMCIMPFILRCYVLTSLSSLLSCQGEDGFPGFKGDMGIKGDRVSMCQSLLGCWKHHSN